MNIVTVTVKGSGTHRVTAAALDHAIAKYLPASPFGLRQIVADRTGEDPGSLEVTALLAMLADFDHNVDGDPLSADPHQRAVTTW